LPTGPDALADRFPLARTAVCAGAFVGCLVLVGGGPGVVLAVFAAGGCAALKPAPRPAPVDPDEAAVVIDLIAGCLDAGVGLCDALGAAAHAAERGLGDRCRVAAAALRSGAPAVEVWHPWLADPCLAPLARVAIRTSASGAATAAELRRASSRIRSLRRAQAQDRVRRAAVWLVAPLGLCFLPAFVLVAVVPLVLGLLATLR